MWMMKYAKRFRNVGDHDNKITTRAALKMKIDLENGNRNKHWCEYYEYGLKNQKWIREKNWEMNPLNLPEFWLVGW